VSNFMRRLLAGNKRQPGALITAVVGTAKNGGWAVAWTGSGVWPPRIQAETLNETVDQVVAAVAALYAEYPPVQGAELQFVFYPWGYKNGPVFDISGHAGALTARDMQGSGTPVSGGTPEDLVEAVRQLPGGLDDDSMFRWVRKVASLPRPT
jgi:hypothetical protein